MPLLLSLKAGEFGKLFHDKIKVSIFPFSPSPPSSERGGNSREIIGRTMNTAKRLGAMILSPNGCRANFPSPKCLTPPNKGCEIGAGEGKFLALNYFKVNLHRRAMRHVWRGETDSWRGNNYLFFNFLFRLQSKIKKLQKFYSFKFLLLICENYIALRLFRLLNHQQNLFYFQFHRRFFKFLRRWCLILL